MRATAHGFLFNHQWTRIDSETVAGDGNAPRQRPRPEWIHAKPQLNEQRLQMLPNSKRVYVGGELHPDVRVPFREISLAPTKSMTGEIEVNEPVRVYDTSGPWGDPSVTLDPVQGLPPLRRDWILKRGDVEEIEGRVVRPIDDGYLSDKHAAHALSKRPTFNAEHPASNSELQLQAPGQSRCAQAPAIA